MTAATERIEEFWDAWMGALRSGRYRQGQGMLKDEDRYCCLGVALDVARLEFPDLLEAAGVSVKDVNGGMRCDAGEGWSTALLPWAFADLIGLEWDGTSSQHELISMNDDGRTFRDIAYYLRYILLGRRRVARR